MKDTTLKEIQYGRTIDVIVNGRKVKRFFKLLYCAQCGKQLRARRIASGPRQGQLYSSVAHNNRRTCNKKCQSKLHSQTQKQAVNRPHFDNTAFARAEHKFLYEVRA